MSTLCPNKEVCGSCGWSHIPYDKQLTQKLADINGTFALKGVELECNEILPSPITSHYRNRMDFVIDFEGRVGLRQKGKWWRVIDNHPCFISDKKIEDTFKLTREWVNESELSFFDRKAHTGFLRYAVIRATKSGQVMLNIVTSSPDNVDDQAADIEKALAKLGDKTNPTTLIWSINNTISDVSNGEDLRTISGPGYIEEDILDYTYRISPNAFFQTNSHGAEVLLKTVIEYTQQIQPDNVLDLYCGSGFFGIALASFVKNVRGIELSPEMIRDAEINASINNANISYQAAKAEESDWFKSDSELVLLDPPRSGLHNKTLADLIQHKPKKIIYVSCSYKNFAREMAELGKYYKVDLIKAIDLFPHTPHVEVVSMLSLID